MAPPRVVPFLCFVADPHVTTEYMRLMETTLKHVPGIIAQDLQTMEVAPASRMCPKVAPSTTPALA